jgi:predicted glycoside hydrolase/deacetylase ChbG (UPF0249 family)
MCDKQSDNCRPQSLKVEGIWRILKGVESMKDLIRWILIYGAFIAALGGNAVAVGPESEIRLIIRGDDMGFSHDFNRATMRAFKEGVLTSASLMVPGLYFNEAVALCRANPGLAAGLHITLTNIEPMRPILPPEDIPTLVNSSGFFLRSRAEFESAQPTLEDIEKEILAQIGKARASGLRFVYLDLHNSAYVKWRSDIPSLLQRIAKRERLLVSGSEGETYMDVHPIKWTLLHYSSQDPEKAEFIEEEKAKFFAKLGSMTAGVWYLNSHPGLHLPAHARELREILCAPETKQIIRDRGIQLISYQDLWNEKYGKPQGSSTLFDNHP